MDAMNGKKKVENYLSSEFKLFSTFYFSKILNFGECLLIFLKFIANALNFAIKLPTLNFLKSYNVEKLYLSIFQLFK